MGLSKNKAIIMMILYSAFYCAWLNVTKDHAFLKLLGGNILQMIAPFLSAIWIYQAFRSSKREKSFWSLLLAANLSYFVAQSLWNYEELILQEVPSIPSVADLFWSVQYICFYAAFLHKLFIYRKKYLVAKTFLELLIFLTVASVLSYEFIVHPFLGFALQLNTYSYLYMYFFYSIANLGLFIVTIILYFVLPDNSKVLLFLILGFLLKFIANSINMLLLAINDAQSYFGGYVDPIWALGLLLIGFSAFFKEKEDEYNLIRERFASGNKHGATISIISVLIMYTAVVFVHQEEHIVAFGAVLVLCMAVLLQLLELKEKKETSDALIEAEAKYRGLVEESTLGVFILQEDRIVYANPRFADIFGYSADEISAQFFINFVLPADRQEIAELLDLSLKGVHTPHHQFRGVQKEKTIAHLEAYFTLTIYRGKLAITGSVQDITDRKRTEELLRKSDKLTVAGELAAGIAHEIRNPLTSLKGFVQFLEAGENYKKEYFHIMHAELDRINEIVNDFLTLAKPQATRTAQKDIQFILENVLSFLQPQLLLHNVQVTMKISDAVLPITCDENQLKQLFINIIKNAMEAMSTGGILRIRVKPEKNQEILIRFLDHGTGIPEERMKKLGEPFYTTKEKGTGLGLMMCYKIVESHKGRITFHSKKGKGTMVNIFLPTD